MTNNTRRNTSTNRACRFVIQTSRLIVRATLEGRAAVDQMADDMRVLEANSGGVTESDLHTVGWTSQQVIAHGSKARVAAQMRAVA